MKHWELSQLDHSAGNLQQQAAAAGAIQAVACCLHSAVFAQNTLSNFSLAECTASRALCFVLTAAVHTQATCSSRPQLLGPSRLWRTARTAQSLRAQWLRTGQFRPWWICSAGVLCQCVVLLPVHCATWRWAAQTTRQVSQKPLTCAHLLCEVAVTANGAVPPLVDMLSRGPVPMRCAAAGALCNLALGCPDNQASSTKDCCL